MEDHEGSEINSKEKVLTLDRLPEPSFQEINQWVIPEGACKRFNCLRIRPEPFSETADHDITIAKEAGMTTIIDKAQEESLLLKPVLKQLLQNDSLLKKVRDLPKGVKLSQKDIKTSLGIADLNLIDRVFYVVNHNVDPEFIPLAICTTSKETATTPDPLPPLLSNNRLLRFRLTSILSNPQYQLEFHERQFKDKDETPYSPVISGEINGFVNGCIYSLHQINPSVTADEISVLREYLQHFFNIDYHAGGNSAPVTRLLENLVNLTAAAYFEVKSLKGYENEERWNEIQGGGAVPVSYIKEHAKAAEVAKYLVILYRQVQTVYKEFFPEVYIEPAIEKLRLMDPSPSGIWEEAILGVCGETNGGYKNSEHFLTINSGTVVMSSGKAAFNEETLSFSGMKTRRKVTDTIITAHELAHGIYERLVRSKRIDLKPTAYLNTADHAVNEGFAVMMELLFIDTMSTHPEIFNLDSRDIQDLQAHKKSRLYRLKEQKNGYTEGTYRILHKIYEEGARPFKGRNMSNGLVAIRNFLEGLDPNKTSQVQRDGEEYKKLLKEGNPEKWRQLFAPDIATMI